MFEGIIFCTYFNKNYLQKGLALHTSLLKHNPTAKLWILCMDTYTKRLLDKLKLTGVTTITLSQFEDSQLKKAKKNRSLVEYFWTCTPSLPLYIFKHNPRVNKAIYLDADLYFYSSIKPIIEEMGDNSIYIVEHRYPKDQKYRDNVSGRFNVGLIVFKRDKEGLDCLKRWRKQCNKWCYLKPEPGKMGDQMYLNEWPELYTNLVISKNLGVNTAPWNIMQYQVTNKQSQIHINKDQLIFYHFHQLEVLGKNRFNYAHGYKFTKNTIDYIYKPYTIELTKQYEIINKYDPSFKIDASKSSLSDKIKQLTTNYLKYFTKKFNQ
jgi:hypothetical protein